MGKADGMVAGLLHAGDEAGELENKLLRSWEGFASRSIQGSSNRGRGRAEDIDTLA